MSFREVPNKSVLDYKVHKVSSTSYTTTKFDAENILEDKPYDMSSRWSSDSCTPPQFLILRLSSVAVVTSITFGKYEKNHVCNMKKFKVFGGCDEENMLELLDSGLKNDTNKETFRLKHFIQGHFFPCQYIKIVPLQTWGPSFNFSIWHVALHGDYSKQTVTPAINWHNEFRQKEALRLCLKHFRQNNYMDVFDCLQKKTRFQLEDPKLTKLFEILVKEGKYTETEDIMKQASEDGLFDEWIASQTPFPIWTALISPEPPCASQPASQPLTPQDMDEEDFEIDPETGDVPDDSPSLVREPTSPLQTVPTFPGKRGGHQMCIDAPNQVIYLFGGWNGSEDLGDFWKYNITTDTWTMLSAKTEDDGGPSCRSCHKMIIDTNHGQLYVLGRYMERSHRVSAEKTKSDFYVYDINTNHWTLITDDTAAMGGPSLIFDHQMCIDQTARTIFVFGGQTLPPASEETRIPNEKRYSGLYEYQIPTNTWRQRKAETGLPPGIGTDMRARTSHSMLFHQGLRKLFVFGGQRRKSNTREEPLNDFFSYSVDTEEIEIIPSGTAWSACLPTIGHTQRATIDWERNEIHVMTGVNDAEREHKEKENQRRAMLNEARVTNSFWVYNINSCRWHCFYRNDNDVPDCPIPNDRRQPKPRYAHQLVYDQIYKVHYMFGGNPGGKNGKQNKVRLGDFWRLALLRPSKEEVLRKCKLKIRECKFSELAMNNNYHEALVFLHNKLGKVVDHSKPEEVKEFQKLAAKLFKGPSSDGVSSENSPVSQINPVHTLRNTLFETLSAYFPEDMTHPRNNLTDLVTFPMDLN